MLRRWGFLLLILSVLTGCTPGENPVDDEKDPHFQQGRNLVNAEDFKGATAEFELALQSNPHSAAAHFELGWLYEKAGDFAAAIYHYERHLQLQPDSPHAAAVQERIRGCQQELANSVFMQPNSPNLQKEVDRLTAENNLLRQQGEALRAQLAARNAAPVVPAPQPTIVQPQPAVVQTPPPQPTIATAKLKVYVVKEHDTIRSIATRYGLKPSAILAANPRVDPRKLRVGQTLNLP